MTAWRATVGAAAAIATIVTLGIGGWIWRDDVAAFAEATRDSGVKGVAVILGIYLTIAMVALPVSWFTAVVGYLCGAAIAIALSSVGTTVGACCAFAVGRWVFAPRVAAWIAKKPRMDALSRAIGSDGFKFVVLARLSPLSPFGVLTYAMSVMPVRFAAFAAGTLAGKLPGNVFYAFLGAGAKSLHDAAEGHAPMETSQWVLLTLGIVATGLLLWLLTRAARSALDLQK